MFYFNQYKVTFKHIMVNRNTIRQMNHEGILHVPYAEKTVCCIFKKDEPDRSPLAVGISMCSLKDQFSRSEGRERAFAKAMHQITLSKAKRLQWWKAFWVSDDGRFTPGAYGARGHGILSTDEINGGLIE